MQTTLSTRRPLHWALLLGTALLVTLFLYFIDEGRYSLGGLFTMGNVIAMGVYLLGLAGGLFLVSGLGHRGLFEQLLVSFLVIGTLGLVTMFLYYDLGSALPAT